MAGNLTLDVVRGPLRGQCFAFEEHDTFIFGRSPDCHARLAESDLTASRHHFILEVNPPDACVRDLGSLNGTYVNETKCGGRAGNETPEQAGLRRFPQVSLKHGDRVRVGETVFLVRVTAPARPAQCPHCGTPVLAGVEPGEICASCRDREKREPGFAASALFAQQRAHAPAQPSAPAGIPGYELGKVLGRGGMGAVYAACRKGDQVTVAVKVMLSRVAVDEHMREVFRREIEVTRSLQHPCCVALLDHGSAGSGFYFVMEYCPGGSVDGLMAAPGGRISLEEATPIMLQSLDGLAFAHSKGFVHRDLKPQNILLTAKHGGTAKISDFGLAKSFENAGFSGMTATGVAAGTCLFMAREQLINYRFAQPATDVWSMGATFYHLLTGEYPREFPPGRDPVEVVLRGGVVPIRWRNPELPEGVARVIDRAVADDVAHRYPSAAEFRQALAAVL